MAKSKLVMEAKKSFTRANKKLKRHNDPQSAEARG